MSRDSPPNRWPRHFRCTMIYNVQMDAAVLGDRPLEVTQMPFLGPKSLSLQCRHCESLKVLAGSQYPQSAFQGLSGVAGGGQQQFATQTLRVHLLGIEMTTTFLYVFFVYRLFLLKMYDYSLRCVSTAYSLLQQVWQWGSTERWLCLLSKPSTHSNTMPANYICSTCAAALKSSPCSCFQVHC